MEESGEVESITSKDLRKSESISREELLNILAAVGNSEAKALTLLAMQADALYTGYTLLDRVRDLQGIDYKGKRKKLQDIPNGWATGRRNIEAYLETFSEIGLVARKLESSTGKVIGYQKTALGANLGDVVAGLILELSEKYSLGNLQLLGKTSSPSKSRKVEVGEDTIEYKKRQIAPLLKIYTYLLPIPDGYGLSVHELITLTGESEQIINYQIKHLKRYGFITFESHGSHTAWARYKCNNIELNIQRKPSKSDIRVRYLYSIFRNSPQKSYTSEEIFDLMRPQFPTVDGVYLKKEIGNYLTILKNEGYLVIEGPFTAETGSKVVLVPEKQQMIKDLLALIDSVRRFDPTTVSYGKKIGREILVDKNRVCALMEKARDSSHGVNQRPFHETKQAIIVLLQSKAPLTTEEVTEELKVHGINLSFQTVKSYLIKMRKDGLIIATIDKTLNQWSAVEVTS